MESVIRPREQCPDSHRLFQAIPYGSEIGESCDSNTEGIRNETGLFRNGRHFISYLCKK